MNKTVVSLFRLTIVVLCVFTLVGAAGLQRTSALAEKPITLWTKLNAASPQTSQDQWLADTLKAYTKDTGNEATNVVLPYDQINSKINLAVQSKGDVPDLAMIDGQYLAFFVHNGTLMDLTDFVKGAPWFKDLTPSSVAACTAPDGKIMCVPGVQTASFVYYWKSMYPNGFPATTDDLLKEAARLKKEGKYAVTFKGSENFSLEVCYFSLMHSAGAAFNDENGKAAWANPGTVKVIEFVRTLFKEKYAPEVALATGFDYENAFKNADAGALLAGSWSYAFLNPLTAPDGTKFDNGPDSVSNAAKAGKLGYAPPLVFPGGKPASQANITGWAIPVGSQNVEGAKAFINYLMQTKVDAAFGVGFGAMPAMLSARAEDVFKGDYWKTVADIQEKYSVPLPFLVDYDKGMLALADTFTKLVSQPNLDPMKELQAAQDNYNNSLE
jgi:multiple sugar transport system substrate-binding protein